MKDHNAMINEESGDEFNDDTFGDTAWMGVKEEVYFGSTSLNPLQLDPAIAMIKSRAVVDSDEERPPGMDSPNCSDLPREMLTVEQIEARLGRTSLESLPTDKWFPVRSKKPTIITFPESKNDPHKGMMAGFERESIARIHIGQLITENPDIEDFYYKSYIKRLSARRKMQNSAIPLYLPLPTPKKPHPKNVNQPIKENEVLTRALGKKSSSSSKRPRQQLIVPTSAKMLATNAIGADVQYSVIASIEHIYEVVFKIEDALGTDSNTDYDAQYLQDKRKEAIAVIESELLLQVSSDEFASKESLLLRFLNLLALSKAKRILGRALKAIDSPDFSETILGRIVELFEYFDICRVDAPESDISLFVNSILASLVPYVAKCSEEKVMQKIEILHAKSSLAWIVCNKAGLVLLCILISRMEILKNETTTNTKWSRLSESLFDRLQERFSEIFAGLNGIDSEFYGWQFMALLALNVDADRKRIIVIELRERILMIVQSGDPKAIANLNIFLNSLGLDASQLSLS